ncbi:hypothetical protein B5C34_00390 [Pacificimonas flava]|uniref:protein-glutamate O-methyltransferase n=1 Tax=Pacificimonas flava TaxID=1234595 RepID=A0A219B838_9SPHN|nr:hypothetical protein B5C34_00390 [Pacificimonas flava]
MSETSFCRFADLLDRRVGMKLAAEKSYLLGARLGPLLQREGMNSLDELAAALGKGSLRLEAEVAEAMLNNETFFFRDRVPFDQFRATLLPRLMAARAAQRRLRIWSAACSTGQEPYSLAMILAEEASKLAGWSIEIVATDISRHALSRAEAGAYSQFEVQRGLDTPRLVKYFSKEGDRWRLSDDIRRRVRFERANLTEPLRFTDQFDLIFARNVLMYFKPERKTEALKRLRASLRADGALLLGAAETIFGNKDLFAPDPSAVGYYRPAAVFSSAARNEGRMATQS